MQHSTTMQQNHLVNRLISAFSTTLMFVVSFIVEYAYMLAIAFALFVLLAVQSFAQSDTIAVDASTLITNVNVWIPIMFGILALPAGIRIAMRVVNFIIEAFVDAFR